MIPFHTTTDLYITTGAAIKVIPFFDRVPDADGALWVSAFYIEDSYLNPSPSGARDSTQLLVNGRAFPLLPVFVQPSTDSLNLDRQDDSFYGLGIQERVTIPIPCGALLELQVTRLLINAHRMKAVLTGSIH